MPPTNEYSSETPRPRTVDHYRFLGYPFVVASEDRDFSDPLDGDFSRFKAPPFTAGDSPTAIRLCFREGAPCLGLGDLPPIRLDPSGYAGQAFFMTLHFIWSRLDGFFLVHAGVVGDGRQTLVLAGPAGSGKTTLVRRLVSEGFHFFSDDCCPVDRLSGRVRPFPRSLRVVPGEGGETSPAGPGFFGDGKRPLPVDKLGGTIAADPLPPGAVVLLDTGAESAAVRELRLGTGPGARTRLIPALAALHPAISLAPCPDGAGWWLTFPLHRGLTALVRDVLRAHRDQVRDVTGKEPKRPDFSAPPRLEEVPAHEAAFRLFSDVRYHDLKAHFLPDRDGPPPLAEFLALGNLIRSAACYRLRVGDLEQTLGLLRGVCARMRSR